MSWFLAALFLIFGWLISPTGGDFALRAPVMPNAVPTTDTVDTQNDATPVPQPDTDRPSGEDLTCRDFGDQAAAQAAFDDDRGDPHGLDLDLDGIACETPFLIPVDERDSGADESAAASPAPPEGRAVNCADFAFQEDAQIVYDRIAGDPYNLDPSGDGYACSSLPSRDG